ncbi:MAG: hypothetical protein QOI87_1381, partial [Bradyrhizobium sp.]|nr:hypothetical protein [Bradyrhizobium sp.]
MCCGARPPERTRRHTAATWLMRGIPLWEAAGFLGMSVEVLEDNYTATPPTLCMARLMPLHPSHGRFRWLKQWLTLKVLGKKGKKPNDYLVGVAGFEPATPASRTQCSLAFVLIFLVFTAFASICFGVFRRLTTGGSL